MENKQRFPEGIRAADLGRLRAVFGDPLTRELVTIAIDGGVPARAMPTVRGSCFGSGPLASMAVAIATDPGCVSALHDRAREGAALRTLAEATGARIFPFEYHGGTVRAVEVAS